MAWTARSAPAMSGTCRREGSPTVRLAYSSAKWLGFSMSMVILARGHGSGSVDKQCSNSEVMSAEMTGRASPCGRESTAGPTVPLLFCVWVRAARCTCGDVGLILVDHSS